MNSRIFLLLALSVVPITCRSNASTIEDASRLVIDSPSRGVVDSAISIEESLRRFQADIPQTVTGYSNGAQSKDALVQKFIESLEKQDTASLAKLAVSRAEFAYLYYPNHPKSKPPYELSPQLMWFQITSNSDKGLRRALRSYGGKHLNTQYSCADSSEIQNGNRIWTRCEIGKSSKDQPPLMLFSAIIGREGTYKILSYSNSL